MESTFKTFKILKYFEKYHGKEIKINTNKEDIDFDFLFNKYSLPHLLGLHYQYKRDRKNYFDENNNIVIPKQMYKDIINKKISDQEILNKISVNTKDYRQTNSVKQRIDTFLEFMQNLEKGYIVENTSEKSDIKSNYIIVEDKNKKYHHLFIMKTENGSLLLEYNDEKSRKYLETYFVRNNDKYFKKSKIKENIKSIEVYDEEKGSYIPFSFREDINMRKNGKNTEVKSMEKNINELLKELIDGKVFNADQKREIKQGLINGLTIDQVSTYADKKYNCHQMNVIRAGLESGLTKDEIRLYADERFNSLQMEQIRYAIQDNISNDEIMLYADPKFDWEQMREIFWGLYEGLAVGLYDDPKFNSMQMQEIRLGLESGLFVSLYADPQFNCEQMYEIRLGLEKDLDTRLYANPKFDGKEMHKIRQYLEEGVDLSAYANDKLNFQQIEQIIWGINKGLEVSLYADEKFDWEQMRQIRYGLESGLDVSLYANEYFDWKQMEQIRKGIESGLDVSVYADPKFDFEQMEEIRLGLENGLSIEQVGIYANEKYNWKQMVQIRAGLENGLSIDEIIGNDIKREDELER